MVNFLVVEAISANLLALELTSYSLDYVSALSKWHNNLQPFNHSFRYLAIVTCQRCMSGKGSCI